MSSGRLLLQEDGEEKTVLPRNLGALDLTLIGLGASIGSGIFVLSGVALNEAGPACVISFGVAAAVCVLSALCYAELATRFPSSGGAYLFVRQALGQPWALIVAVNLLFDYHIAAASIARAFSGYLRNLIVAVAPGGDASASTRWMDHIPVSGIVSGNVVAPVLLVLLTAVLCRGAKEGATINRILTGTKIATILLVMFAGCTRVEPSLWWRDGVFPEGVAPVAVQSATLFFAYVGFDVVANTAEEAKDPARTIPLGIVLSLLACAVLYGGVVLVLAGLVAYEDVDTTAPLAAAFDDQVMDTSSSDKRKEAWEQSKQLLYPSCMAITG